MNKLRKLTNFGMISWVRKLKAATFAVNISFNRSIGTSPYFLKFGRQPQIDIDVDFDVEPKQHEMSYIIKERNAAWNSYKKKNIEKGKKIVKYNLKENTPVLVYREPLKDKFAAAWIEGFHIVRHLEPDAYEVRKGNATMRCNKKHVKQDFSKSGEGDVATCCPSNNIVASLEENF